ncbi:unnamed protein product, partial [Symbiodinium natans]
LQQESSTRQAEMTEVNKRLDDLAGRIEQISKQRGENFQAVPPPDPWARATFASSSATGSDAWSNYKPAANAPHPARPTTNASSPAQPPPLQRQQPQPQPNAFSDTGSGPGSAEAQGTNYNNVILGGFAKDTPRKLIELEIAKAISLWDPVSRSSVQRTTVFGQRARTGMVCLRPLPVDQARERFFQLKANFGHMLSTNTDEAWMSAEKSAEQRKRNRATRTIRQMLEKIKGGPVAIEDIDWTRQIMWIGSCRVVAANLASLHCQPTDKICSRATTDDYGERSTFFFNVTGLASCTSTQPEAVEAAIQSA